MQPADFKKCNFIPFLKNASDQSSKNEFKDYIWIH